MGMTAKRLMKELKDINDPDKGLPEGLELVSTDDSIPEWKFKLMVLGESVYKGEVFMVKLKFPANYPLESPSTTFQVGSGYKAPEHGHCYSNGHVCLSILSSGSEGGWSPCMTACSILLSLQSMLASSKRRERPPDDARYIRSAPSDPKQSRFVYHDDTV